MTPFQLRILQALADRNDWTTRNEIKPIIGQMKGYAAAMGAPTTGVVEPNTLEGMGYVEHRKRKDGSPVLPLEYRITGKGKQVLGGTNSSGVRRSEKRPGTTRSKQLPLKTGILSLSDQCVFTIRKLSDLNLALRGGGIGQFTENKSWSTASKMLEATKETGEHMPIFFSDAEHTGLLYYWGILTAIEVDERTTTYRFEQLRRFTKQPKQNVLRIASSGERLSPSHRRPYVLCLTPALDSLLFSQMVAAECEPDGEIEQQFDLAAVKDEREQSQRAITIRRGQPAFRKKLVSAYKGRCAVTGCNASDALEAAHISPYCGEQSNHVANGLLLRADLHTLFDLNLFGIEPTTATIRLAPVLRQSSYRGLEGKKLAIPSKSAHRPSRDALVERWHQFSSNGKKPKE